MTDRELLDQITRDRSETAFTELVRRHIDLVHSAALRQLGDADTARDITQNVFLLLAREAGRLPAAVVLSGWLYRTTRNLCLETLRRDQRRRQREQTAAEQLMNDATANPWEQVAPALEPAMDELGETDRQAVLLRYFENRSLREVGAALGLGEDAAQKRVSRALDRLRDIFSRRGVSLSATALAGSLSAGAVQAAPVGLAVTISSVVLSGTAIATAITLDTATTMSLFNLKTAAAILGAAAVTGTTTYLVQERETDRVRADYQTLNETHALLAKDQQEALAMIQLRDEQIERLKRDVADLPRLRGEVDQLRRQLSELAALREKNEELTRAIAGFQQRLKSDQEPALNNELESKKEEEKQRGLRRMTELRQLGMALILHTESNDGWYPNPAEFLKILEFNNQSLLELRPENIAITFQGHVEDIVEPAKTIVARQINYLASFDGRKIHRAYLFADGHTEIHSAADPAALTVWENERTIPPELQSRRPD